MTALDFPDLAGALCAQLADPELFFPKKGESLDPALEVCAECPVRLACLEYAMANPVAGIWGGTSHKQRVDLAHRQGQPYNYSSGVTDAARVGVQPASLRRRDLREGAVRKTARDRSLAVERAGRVEEARRLDAEGVSADVIAALLNVGVRTVREKYLREVS